MTLNRDYVGQSVKSSEVLEVTQEKLRDAVAQFEEPHPAYTDPAAARELGYSAVIAPPAFAGRLWFRMVWAWPMNEPTLGRKPGSIRSEHRPGGGEGTRLFRRNRSPRLCGQAVVPDGVGLAHERADAGA